MLSDVKIRQAKAEDKPYRLRDSHGLYLEVRPNGTKHWRYRYRINDKENLFAIGTYPTISLMEARKARDEARELIRTGIHPSQARRKQQTIQRLQNTEENFELIAREWLKKKEANWSPYYHRQAIKCLENNAFPVIGKMPIRAIKPADLLNILQEMESRGAETFAMHLRQWCSAIFRYAVVTLRADHDPAASLKGAVMRPKVTHCRPMLRNDITDFLSKVDQYGGNLTTVITLRLLLYLFVRTVELRKARWEEFDLENAIWVIPESRMKMKRKHLVPLSAQAIELITVLRSITGANDFLFPNSRRPTEDCMSATTINRALEHMGYPPGSWTAHDFRATASTHLHEMGFSSLVIERQLAHVETNRVRGAYNHAEYLEERRSMMQSWADWIDALHKKNKQNQAIR